MTNAAASNETYGEKLIASLLAKFPTKQYFYKAQLHIPYRGNNLKPDFVIVLRNKGVAVVEVKDWVEILNADQESIEIRRRDGERMTQRNPALVVEEYAYALTDRFKERQELCERYQGKIKLS